VLLNTKYMCLLLSYSRLFSKLTDHVLDKSKDKASAR